VIVEATKRCGGKNGCGRVLPVSAFNRDNRAKNGLRTYCRKCSAAENKRSYAENPEPHRRVAKQWRQKNPDRIRRAAKQWQQENPITVKAHSLKRHARRSGPSDIDIDWIMERLDRGVCEKSGEPFVYGHAFHPGGPSIDRIDPNQIGHMKDNCRVVLWCLNAFKGTASEELFDEYLEKICAAFGKSRQAICQD